MSPPPDNETSLWDRLAALPDLERDPPSSADAAPGQYYVPAPDPPTVPAPSPAPAPVPEPGAGPPPAGTRRWRRPLRIALAVLALLVLAFAAMAIWSWVLWRQVDQVELDGVLSTATGDGTNYLIVGTDSREGVDPDNPNAGVIFGDTAGERTDTVVILRRSDAGNRIIALPRDLWLPIAGAGGEQRLNTAFAGGPEQLVRTVQESLGLPVHHYLEVDFAGFLGLVDAVGGITIDFEYPASDPKSGLDVPEAGPVHLDADQALAYVRSRAYTEIVDGQRRVDGTGDLGRVDRQQAFLDAVFDKVGGTRNPVTLLRVLDALSGNIRLDDRWSYWGALGFARQLDGLDPESVVLPTFPFTTDGGAAVLGLADGAEEVLAQFR